MPRVKSAKDLTVTPVEDKFAARGITFHLVELSMADYDDLVEKHTTRKRNPLTDLEEETIDEQAFTRDLLRASMVQPALSPEGLVSLGTRLVRMLERRVRNLHMGEEAIEIAKVETADDDNDEVADPDAPPSDR